MKAYTRRDLTIMPLTASESLVIACDSCGAIGSKSGDIFQLSPWYAAKHTLRVALTEVMCSGALPAVITNGVCCEMDPTGQEMIQSIQAELHSAGLCDVVLTGSTEENFSTSMTALAITVIGRAKTDKLRFCRAVSGDQTLLIGTPRVGQEVNLDGKGFYEEIRLLLSMPGVKEIVPVGSKGVLYEANVLAGLSGGTFRPCSASIDYYKSAGPATCLLVLCKDAAVRPILAQLPAALAGEIL